MLIIPVITSLIVGILLGEAMRRLVMWRWCRAAGLQEILALPQAFRQAMSDDARQTLLLRTGRTTLIYSLYGFTFFAGLAALVYLPLWAMHWSAIQNITYLVLLSVVAALWWVLRRAPSARNALNSSYRNYGPLQRWLHWLAMEPAVVRHLAFDLERQFALPKHRLQDHNPADGAVYVCGLARSGTTILLRVLDRVDAFKSLTYRDMPFVLAPNLWHCIMRGNAIQAVAIERPHRDSILVDFDSPESFEEVFWRTFGEHRLSKFTFGVERPAADTMANFADYRVLVAGHRRGALPFGDNARRYLSKNNNNLLRLDALSADTTATVLLLYRDPLATARSLHQQHLQFCALQKQNAFVQRYMGWLGHYEFGLDHRPFAFAAQYMSKAYTPSDLDYWLDYWNAVYGYVLTLSNLPFHLVDHAKLCTQPAMCLKALFRTLGVQGDAVGLAALIAAPAKLALETNGFAPDLVEKAMIIHSALQANHRNLFT